MIPAPSRHLLSVDHQKVNNYRSSRLLPAAAAVLNLFFCAYFERFLKHDADGFYLSLFLFLEGSAYAVLSSSNFHTVSSEILSKSRIFPLRSIDRLMFAIAGNLRRPIVLSVFATNSLFLFVLYRYSFWFGLLATVVLVLLIISIEVALSTVMLALGRRSIPSAAVMAAIGFVFFLAIVGSIVFHYETLLSSIPLILWSANGILAATRGETARVFTSLALLISTTFAVFIVGRRFA